MSWDNYERNITLTSMEIAYMVLTGKLGEDVCERVLDLLDINDNDAGILESNLELLMDEAAPHSALGGQ